MKLVIGTRGSALAVAQAKSVKERLEEKKSGLKIEIMKIKTTGDIRSFGKGEIGVFVREIDEALLKGEIDIGVHSLKDIPTFIQEELCLCAVTKREDARDCLVSRDKRKFDEIPLGSVIGTASLRRIAWIKHLRCDLNVVEMRGNIDTRLRKIEKGEVSGIVIAYAGLLRLKLEDIVSDIFSTEILLPAAGQGTLGIIVRSKDENIKELLSVIDDFETHVSVKAERAFIKRLGGGCQVPAGAYAEVKGNNIVLKGGIGTLDGRNILKREIAGSIHSAEETGEKLAEEILCMGGKEILENIEILEDVRR